MDFVGPDEVIPWGNWDKYNQGMLDDAVQSLTDAVQALGKESIAHVYTLHIKVLLADYARLLAAEKPA